MSSIPPAGSPGGATLELLRAVLRTKEPRVLELYREVERLNPEKELDTGELVALSAKLSTRGLFQDRYDSCIHWHPRDHGRFYDSVLRAAPTEALHRHLEQPDNPIRRRIESSRRFFSYLAVDHDHRVYKLYLFRHQPVSFLEELDFGRPTGGFEEQAYIRCIELDMDEPERFTAPVYFKLKLERFSDVLEPGYRPHPALGATVLRAVERREEVVALLRPLLQGVQRVNDPVAKLRLPVERPGQAMDPGRLATLDQGLSVNLYDPGAMRFVNDHAEGIQGIGAALGCGSAVAHWLETLRPFDCFLSYICLGPDFITLYYKTTRLHRRRPAAHLTRQLTCQSARLSRQWRAPAGESPLRGPWHES